MNGGELTLPGSAQAPRRATKLTPTTGWPKPIRKAVPFSGLILFTLILFAAPQNVFPSLEPLMLAKISVLMAVVPYLLNRAMMGRPLTMMTPTVRWVLIFGLIGILSIPAGFWPGGSVSVLIDLFGKSIVIFLLVANVVDTERRFRTLVATMIGCGAFAAANAVIHYMTGYYDPSGQRIVGYEAGLLANPNDLSLMLNIVLGLALGLLPVQRHRPRRWLLLGAMGLLIAGIIASFSRSGFITLGVLGVMWIAQALRERGGRALPSIALVVLAVLVAVPAGYSDRLSTIVDTDADPTGSANERWNGMVAGVHQIAERPLLGYGLGNSIHELVISGRGSREVHNAYLQVGAELGVVGMVVYVLFILSAYSSARAVRRFFARRREGWELGRLAAGVEMSVVAFAVGALFSPVPYHFFFYFPAGLAVAIFAIGARVPPSVPGRGR